MSFHSSTPKIGVGIEFVWTVECLDVLVRINHSKRVAQARVWSDRLTDKRPRRTKNIRKNDARSRAYTRRSAMGDFTSPTFRTIPRVIVRWTRDDSVIFPYGRPECLFTKFEISRWSRGCLGIVVARPATRSLWVIERHSRLPIATVTRKRNHFVSRPPDVSGFRGNSRGLSPFHGQGKNTTIALSVFGWRRVTVYTPTLFVPYAR